MFHLFHYITIYNPNLDVFFQVFAGPCPAYPRILALALITNMKGAIKFSRLGRNHLTYTPYRSSKQIALEKIPPIISTMNQPFQQLWNTATKRGFSKSSSNLQKSPRFPCMDECLWVSVCHGHSSRPGPSKMKNPTRFFVVFFCEGEGVLFYFTPYYICYLPHYGTSVVKNQNWSSNQTCWSLLAIFFWCHVHSYTVGLCHQHDATASSLCPTPQHLYSLISTAMYYYYYYYYCYCYCYYYYYYYYYYHQIDIFRNDFWWH